MKPARSGRTDLADQLWITVQKQTVDSRTMPRHRCTRVRGTAEAAAADRELKVIPSPAGHSHHLCMCLWWILWLFCV